jgi:hypothetical protein
MRRDWGFAAQPVLLFYNNVAELRQFRGTRTAPRSRFSAAAENLNVQVTDFLAQGIPVDPEQVGGADLITAGGRERHRQ